MVQYLKIHPINKILYKKINQQANKSVFTSKLSNSLPLNYNSNKSSSILFKYEVFPLFYLTLVCTRHQVKDNFIIEQSCTRIQSYTCLLTCYVCVYMHVCLYVCM